MLQKTLPMTRQHLTSLLMKASLAAACSTGLSAQAQDAARRLKNTIAVAGQKIETDQCTQNRGMEPAQFKALCDNRLLTCKNSAKKAS